MLQKKSCRFGNALFAGVLFICLFRPERGFALDPTRDILQYNCQSWSRQNGLPANGINAIAQTGDGYLWLGTTVGLVRFDGVEFKLFDLAGLPEIQNSIVTSLASSKNGGLWVGLENNAFGFYDGQSFSFRGKNNFGTVHLNVRTILESKDGSIWLASEDMASRLTLSGNFEEVLSSSTNFTFNIECGYEDSHGRLWFGTANAGVYYWQNGKINKLDDPALDGLPVDSIAEDLQGQIWIGTSAGLHCYNAALKKKEIPVLPDEIRALLVDRHGVLWIGTSGEGLARYQNGQYSFFRKTDGLTSDFVKSLAEDREGSLWVGTRDGLSRLSDVKFPTYQAAADPLVIDAMAVAASHKGGVWIGSSGGLTYFNGKYKTFGVESGITNTFVKRIFEASNRDIYLVSGTDTLLVFSKGKVVAAYTAPNMVVGIAEDARGVVASIGPNLYRVGTNYFTPYIFTNGQPTLAWVLNLASGRDGEIWVACGTGIFRVKDGGFQQWTPQPPASEPVQWICQDSDGTVWGAQLTGIVRLKNNQLKYISRKDGLFDNNIYSIIPDDFGNLWVDSGRGIFRVSRKSMNDFADGNADHVECTAFDDPESVKPSDKTTQEHVGCKTADGRIWFPSAHGIVEIDPAHIPTNQMPPPVHINSVSANGVELPRSESLIVPPGRGELEFHFAALSFIAPQKIRFRYQLEGYDKDWVEAGGRRMAFYTNLKPGNYTFHVIAANADGVWNQTGDSLRLELRPHFFQTIWFYFLCGGCSVAALFGIYFWRVNHLTYQRRALQKTRKLLEAEVQDRMAELAKVNDSLRDEIKNHEHTAGQLHQRTHLLEKEIQERKQMESEMEKIHKKLLETSRQAGRSEVATSVLHNVGNVLNSVNVSASLVVDSVKKSKAAGLAKVVELLRAHEKDLGAFITGDSRGRHLPNYLAQLSEHLLADQKTAGQELDLLLKNIEHIKDIVAMQQSYARVSGVKEVVNVPELVEDSMRMNIGALDRHGIEVVRDFEPTPPINLDRHKVLQILVNLIRNAKYACDESGRPDKRLTLRILNNNDCVKIMVIDNGVGISPENLARIFSHGFTTRKDGHGFGLHSSALAAKEMGGSLHVHSDGSGHGAMFTLELPCAEDGGAK